MRTHCLPEVGFATKYEKRAVIKMMWGVAVINKGVGNHKKHFGPFKILGPPKVGFATENEKRAVIKMRWGVAVINKGVRNYKKQCGPFKILGPPEGRFCY